jgi:hypothetical protein
VVDEIGIVVSCTQTDFLAGAHTDISVSNPFGDMGLQIEWDAGLCVDLKSVTLRFSAVGHELVGQCSKDVVASGLPLYLTLSEPLPAEFIYPHLTAAPGSSPIATATLPAPATPENTPNPDISARERIDRFWESFGDVGCIGMAAPESIEMVAGWADLIVMARPTGAQLWEGAPYPEPNSLITLQVSEVLKGAPTYQQGGFIQLYGSDVPSANVADVDHLLFLSVLTRDSRVYYMTDSFTSIYANVDGHVVTAEYAAIKQAYGHHLFPTDLDGTSFDKLVQRVTDAVNGAGDHGTVIAQRGYFAC